MFNFVSVMTIDDFIKSSKFDIDCEKKGKKRKIKKKDGYEERKKTKKIGNRNEEPEPEKELGCSLNTEHTETDDLSHPTESLVEREKEKKKKKVSEQAHENMDSEHSKKRQEDIRKRRDERIKKDCIGKEKQTKKKENESVQAQDDNSVVPMFKIPENPKIKPNQSGHVHAKTVEDPKKKKKKKPHPKTPDEDDRSKDPPPHHILTRDIRDVGESPNFTSNIYFFFGQY